MHFSGTKGKNTLPTSPKNLPLRLEGACDWRQREITAIPPIRPTGSLRIALGERCFRDPPPTGGTRSAHLPVYGRLVIACTISGLNRRNAVPPFGRPAQHLSPITSYARFESVLAHLESGRGMSPIHL